jgi:hypothetical protein
MVAGARSDNSSSARLRNAKNGGTVMAKRSKQYPLLKFVAISLGGALCAIEAGLNVEHIARLEGWESFMVYAFAGVNLGAALTPLFVESAWRNKAWTRSIALWLACLVLVCFSFTTTVDRISGKRDGAEAVARHGNERGQLARDALSDAIKVRDAECTKNPTGKRCQAAEADVTKAREALAAKPAESTEHGMAKRISAALPFLTMEAVELYQPLLLPLGLQLSGFLMLGFGFAPRPVEPEPKETKRKSRNKTSAKPAKTNADRQREFRERQKVKLSVVK